MKAWEDYAMITPDGVIQNMACFAVGGYTMAQYVAKEMYGSDAFAVEVTQVLVDIGDHYHDCRFYNVDPDTGEETVATVLPTAEEVAQANSDAIDNIIASMLEE